MKKHVTTRQLGRDSQARKALFRNLISSLIEHEEIVTTSAKARAVRGMFEKFLTKGKTGSLNARRDLQAYIQSKSLVKKMIDEIAPRYQGVAGGYTKLIMVGARRGDSARMVKLALTKRASAPDKQHKPAKTAKTAVKKEAKQVSEAATIPTAPTESPKTIHTAPKVASRVVKRGDR